MIRRLSSRALALAAGILLVLAMNLIFARIAAAQPAPHDALHDPVTQPTEAIRDVTDVAKVSWAGAVAAAVLIACKLAGFAKSRLAWLAVGWRPVVFTLSTALATGVYDMVRLGGTGVALVIAGLVSLTAAIPNKGPAAPPSPAPST